MRREESKEEENKEEEEEEEEEAEAEAEAWKYIYGFTNMAVVKCAHDLKIADAIESHQGPITISDLSSTLNCSPSSIYRIMRFLVHQNIFKEKPTNNGSIGYIHTPLSRLLLSKGEKSLKALFLLESSTVMLAPWNFLRSCVLLDGTAAFEAVHGDDLWRYAAANPDHSKLFNEGVASEARLVVNTLIEQCPQVFDGIKSLVDVGGGNGTAMSMLVKAFPWINEGINFDLPHVVSVATPFDGVKHVGGDMFHSVPPADAVFIMRVLHDWNDEKCIKILKKCKEAIQKGKGKVIIVEAVVGEAKKDDKLEIVRLMLDMVMMVHTNTGKERTSREWEYVIREAGFTSHSIDPIGAVQYLIQAFP